MKHLAFVCVACVIAGSAAAAHASVTRYALVVGNDLGDRDEMQLSYAERDADRMAGVLTDLGGFAPENVALLRGVDADAMRAALISLNARIRSAGPGETMLVVYYSGHADADALHLGPTSLSLGQLEQLVRGSSATFRLLILDSCRSGALTRVKGGRATPALPIVLGDSLEADGVVFWTASAASEDAQESDEIKGSFFSHYLVSGLAGPADSDGDGRVTTSEAYQYARAATQRASSRTLNGTQHPTFRDELRGRLDVVLTNPGASLGRAGLAVAADRDVLIFAGSADGPVVAEIGAYDRSRRVSLRPGRYFVRERTERFLLEGSIAVSAGVERTIRDDELVRVEYTRLARKGARDRHDGVEAGYLIQTALLDGGTACQGVVGGYVLDLDWVTVTPRVSMCREAARNSVVASTTDELASDVRLAHAWQLSRIELAAQVQLGGAILHQRFDTLGTAPARSSAGVTFGGGGQAALELARGVSIRLAGEAGSYLLRRDEAMAIRWRMTPVLRAILALGVAF